MAEVTAEGWVEDFGDNCRVLKEGASYRAEKLFFWLLLVNS